MRKKIWILVLILVPLLWIAVNVKSYFDRESFDGPYISYVDNKLHILSFSHDGDKTKFNASMFDLSEKYTKIFTSKSDNPDIKPVEFMLHEFSAENPCIYDMPEKIFAVSDIEGNFYAMQSLLIKNKVISEDYKWTFGKGHLVIVGDMFDRGEDVLPGLWLIYSLEEEAQKAGGKVHYILGNHDRMNLIGDDRYLAEKYKNSFDKFNLQVEDLFTENTELGRWIRTKNIVERIGDILFVHGGLSEELVDKEFDIKKINQLGKKYIDKVLEKEDKDYDEYRLIVGTYGPLWYRGLVEDYKSYNKISPDALERILNAYKSSHIVVGHTIVDKLSADFDGKVIRIDCLQPTSPEDGENQALLIEKNAFYRVTNTGIKEKLNDLVPFGNQ